MARAGEGGRAVARPDTVLNRWRPPRLASRRRPRHAHAAERVPVNFRFFVMLYLCVLFSAKETRWRFYSHGSARRIAVFLILSGMAISLTITLGDTFQPLRIAVFPT